MDERPVRSTEPQESGRGSPARQGDAREGSAQREPARDGSTRERILAAAAAIIGEDGITARLSVRAVAARAEVSIGSLRHHFPTQQVLRDEVMRRVYDWMLPETSIHDTAVPARDRLVSGLRGILDLSGVGGEARTNVTMLTSSFIAAEPTEPVRATYLAMQRDGQRRMEEWLRVLAAEAADGGAAAQKATAQEAATDDAAAGDAATGAETEEDVARGARFLATVLDGLALERALPAEDSLAQAETDSLYMAADAVLGVRPRS